MPIRILPPEVADKIAAGEVVERPASVVKELIENSLDAGATDITVEIREGGRRLIRVSDNGSGIPAAEAPLALQRHATSKLRTADDLEHLTTLGFRGEALAAIAAVSRLTLVTRSVGEPVGIELRVEGGTLLGSRPMAAPPGTVLTVEGLFWNVPARLKFLRSDTTEAGHIGHVVTRYALAFPEVRFSYLNEGRLVFRSPGNGDRQQVLLRLLDAESTRQMLTIAADPDPLFPTISVEGFVSAPSLHRANRGSIELFVNRRLIQDRNLAFAVIQAYHTLLPGDRFPIAFVFISLPPEEVDVNVHPTKAEVRFRQAALVFRAVQRAVHRTLVETAPVVNTLTTPAEGREGPIGPREEAYPTQLSMNLPPADAGMMSSAVVPAPSSSSAAPTGGRLPPLRAIGQVAAAYLVAEGPGGLYLIDQHAAHERILYETILAAPRRPVAQQQLLEPVAIEIGTRLAGLIAEHLETLRQSGFDLEPFGNGAYLLRAVPAFMGRQDPQHVLSDVAESLAAEADAVAQDREQALIRVICKRLAIKAGQVLSLREQAELLRQLEACENPRTCPHGRPTVLHLSAAQLERQFGRE
ncbi:MAG: DNA mismatch repair endonuclease MutL [Caldilineales bacterium]|nr:DNA mismatch repair endonuclease MutL [Caldilineales bacterium]